MRKTGVLGAHELANLIGQLMCLPHNHHTFALETSVSASGTAALDRPVKDDPYVLKYATCLVDSMHITTLCSRRWHDSSQKYGDGSAITTCSQFSTCRLVNRSHTEACVVAAASASCPSFCATDSTRSVRERICKLVAQRSRSLNDYPAQAMARPGRNIKTSCTTWETPRDGSSDFIFEPSRLYRGAIVTSCNPCSTNVLIST
jgi:hypothetical protein